MNDEPHIAQSIDQLAKTVAAYQMAMSVQMIEVQALVNVLLDLERDRMVKDGQLRQDVARFVQEKFEANRNKILSTVKDRFLLAGIDADLGPVQ
jgi:hypothetical protein